MSEKKNVFKEKNENRYKEPKGKMGKREKGIYLRQWAFFDYDFTSKLK